MGFRAPLDTREYERRVGMIPAPAYEEKLPENPVRRGFGSDEFTTETTLSLRREVWDVNGWYRCLGFSYPFAGITVRQMRVAYMANGGMDDERMTWVLKALRNSQIRAEYDAMEFGDLYQDDPEVQRWLMRQAAQETSRRRARGEDIDFDGVMGLWGFDLHDQVPVDAESPGGDKVTSEGSEVSDRTDTVQSWAWGYYLWRSRARDLDRLARWQGLLVTEFAAVGDRRRISVGFMGRQPHRATVCELGRKIVLLLNENEQPTQELAALVVASCTGDQNPN